MADGHRITNGRLCTVGYNRRIDPNRISYAGQGTRVPIGRILAVRGASDSSLVEPASFDIALARRDATLPAQGLLRRLNTARSRGHLALYGQRSCCSKCGLVDCQHNL